MLFFSVIHECDLIRTLKQVVQIIEIKIVLIEGDKLIKVIDQPLHYVHISEEGIVADPFGQDVLGISVQADCLVFSALLYSYPC